MMKQILRNLAIEDAGQDLIEYALVGAIIALGGLAVLRGLSTNVVKVFNVIGTQLTNAV